jgi:acetyl esterase/lipase
MKHPIDPQDAAIMAAVRESVRPMKGAVRGIEGRGPFDTLMEGTAAYPGVEFETASVGGRPGIWVRPHDPRPNAAILYLHAGWFVMGTAKASRNLAAHIAGRTGVSAFIPDYRLAPEHPFPVAVEDVLSAYRGLEQQGVRQIALVGDSAGGNLALGLASRATAAGFGAAAKLVGVVAGSPVTDLTLSGESYETRAEADPFFTRAQVRALLELYLSNADARHPMASPLFSPMAGLPPVRIHVGEDEVLLDDSRRYIGRAIAAGVDAELEVWTGMPHGFTANVGRLKAATLALEAIAAFLKVRFDGVA